VPVSRIWTLKATRSTMAATRRGSGEHRAPFAEGQVGRDRDAGPFFAFGDDLEQQLGAACRPRLAWVPRRGSRGPQHAAARHACRQMQRADSGSTRVKGEQHVIDATYTHPGSAAPTRTSTAYCASTFPRAPT